MPTLNTTSFDAFLKQKYLSWRIKDMVYPTNALFAMLPKMENFGGRNLPIPVKYGHPQGRSATFATAQSNKQTGKYEDFLLTRASDYGLASISTEVLQASMGNAHAFASAASQEIDGVVRALARNLCVMLYRSGSGSRGQVGSGGGTTTITLKDTNDIVNFEVGMTLDSDDVDGGGTVDGGSVVVTDIDRDAGTLTAASNWDQASSYFADDDYIFVDGDYDSTISGLEAWCPASAPGATAFFGVDRTADVTRLGGIRYSAVTNNETHEEGLISALARANREGASPTHVFMNNSDWSDLVKMLGTRVEYDKASSADRGHIGFRSLILQGASGPVQVVADHNCQSNVAWILQLDCWKLYSLGPAPKILETNGLRFRWDATADSIEVRAGYYANLGCSAPGFNVRVALNS